MLVDFWFTEIVPLFIVTVSVSVASCCALMVKPRGFENEGSAESASGVLVTPVSNVRALEFDLKFFDGDFLKPALGGRCTGDLDFRLLSAADVEAWFVSRLKTRTIYPCTDSRNTAILSIVRK